MAVFATGFQTRNEQTSVDLEWNLVDFSENRISYACRADYIFPIAEVKRHLTPNILPAAYNINSECAPTNWIFHLQHSLRNKTLYMQTSEPLEHHSYTKTSVWNIGSNENLQFICDQCLTKFADILVQS